MGGFGRVGTRLSAVVPTLRLDRVHVARAGVLATVVLAALVATAALIGGIRELAHIARANASESGVERTYGSVNGLPNAIRDPASTEEMLRLIPQRAAYAVVAGQRWEPVRSVRWTSSLERDFLRYHLFPRRQVEPASAAWIVCLGCDASSFPGTRALARSSDGIVLLERR